jgi:DNA-directed RNA polymerase subunit RPC12/RpoP
MALIQCRECGRDISDQATACPHCGAPRVVQQKVEIEATHRGLKNQMIWAVCLMLGGCVGAMTAGGQAAGFWALLMLAGLVWWLVARMGAWYRNG